MSGNEVGQYEFTTIDYDHPDPSYRSTGFVSVHLQMDYDEIVAGARIEVL